MNKCIYCILFLFFIPASIYAQKPVFGFSLGGNKDDAAYVTKVAPNGNVYVAGKFTDTMDLDPSSGVYNVSSSGFDDIYLACYSSTGTFLWGFGLGGPNYDAGVTIAVDTSSNVILGGYFQSGGIDFDPRTGISIMPYSGGSGLTYYGDGFVAKYSATGNYLWSYGLGGGNIFDHVQTIAVDDRNNIYVGGEFDGLMTIPGGPTFDSRIDGKAFIIKYTSSGVLQWAHNFGLPGGAFKDTEPHVIKVSNGNLYVGGLFQGKSDFDPWGASAYITAVGLYDAFIAKYDTNGNYIFAYPISGDGDYENVFDLALDDSDNIYVTGSTNGNYMIFDQRAPFSTTVYNPGKGGNFDIFIAKYDSSGKHKWGTVLGSTGEDWGRGVDVVNDNVYFTGSFNGYFDFDRLGSGITLGSSGLTDAYIGKYDLKGKYVCGYILGNYAVDDIGYSITHDATGNFYVTGEYGGVIDFDPGTASFPLSPYGAKDGYLLKYDWTAGAGILAGNVKGDTFCTGDSAHLTIVTTSGGSGPFDITYTDGTKVFRKTGVMSGKPFNILPMPTVTTTYTITAVMPSFSSRTCNPILSRGFGSATVIYSPAVLNVTDDSISCNSLKFEATGNFVSGHWDFGDHVTDPNALVTHVYTVPGVYTVKYYGTTFEGCQISRSKMVKTGGIFNLNIGNDTSFCIGYSVQLHAKQDYLSTIYSWNDGSSGNTINVTTSGTYWLHVTDIGGCYDNDTVNIITSARPNVSLGNDTIICSGDSVILTSVYPNAIYQWNTGAAGASISVRQSGTYVLEVTNVGCSISDTVMVKVIQSPVLDFGKDTTLCNGNEIVLNADISNSSITWSDNTHEALFIIKDDGIFSAVISNKCGISYDTIAVKYEACDIWFPNAFSPNSDGRNDLFRPLGNLGKVTKYTLAIFNRFGQQVFSSDDVNDGWDGSLNGVIQDLGTYYYYASFALSGQKALLKGDVLLVR